MCDRSLEADYEKLLAGKSMSRQITGLFRPRGDQHSLLRPPEYVGRRGEGFERTGGIPVTKPSKAPEAKQEQAASSA